MQSKCIYIQQYLGRQAGRQADVASCTHYYASTVMNKQGNYTTIHKGCHNNFSTNKWNPDAQTHKWDTSTV